MNDDLLFLTVTEQAKLLKSRKISSVELTQGYLQALRTRGTALHAVAEVVEEVALQQAQQADMEITSGKYRGVLHGIPYGAKDLFATKGVPTRWGSPAHQQQVFDDDATVIERLRHAGAVLVAKLAMIELAGAGGYEFAHASSTGACRRGWFRAGHGDMGFHHCPCRFLRGDRLAPHVRTGESVWSHGTIVDDG
jgi:aspartyl-tRNA(Asn)/glutamyl-tRNA(Gln) amidotransferase subunit A